MGFDMQQKVYVNGEPSVSSWQAENPFLQVPEECSRKAFSKPSIVQLRLSQDYHFWTYSLTET